ncbi:MAG TPA: AMP-binding protein, partial [Candidatus Acidoferrum sp.]|nr:AMP-binding protein [Candidatus Acidoferrum sp.]
MTISIVEPTSKSPSKAAQTIPGVFFEQAARAGEREYLRFFRDGSWQALSWRETAERATRVACGLIAAGLQPGDHVALLSENRVEWLYCDLAILAAGGVTVPIYPSLTARVAGYIAEDSKTPLAIVSNAQLAEKLSGLDHPKRIFKMETDVVEWVQNAPGLEAER